MQSSAPSAPGHGAAWLGYEDCRKVNPEVVYMELVGFGQAGLYAKRPAYDDIVQGMSEWRHARGT